MTGLRLVQLRPDPCSTPHLRSLTLADWAVVYLLDAAGAIWRSALAHREPTKAALAAELERRYPPLPDAQSLVWRTLREEIPQLVPTIAAADLARGARDAEHRRLLADLGVTSALGVPLLARGQTLGALILFTTASGRSLAAPDLALAAIDGQTARLARLTADLLDVARLRTG